MILIHTQRLRLMGSWVISGTKSILMYNDKIALAWSKLKSVHDEKKQTRLVKEVVATEKPSTAPQEQYHTKTVQIK